MSHDIIIGVNIKRMEFIFAGNNSTKLLQQYDFHATVG